MKKIKLLFLFLALGLSGFSQMDLSLGKCIDFALRNNIGLRQVQNQQKIAVLNQRQSMQDFLPDLNARVGFNRDFGSIVDNLALQRTSGRNSSNASLFSNLTLFSGLSKINTMKQRKAELKASEYAIDKTKNDLKLNVLLYFFQVIFDQENLEITENRKELISKQLEKTKKQLEAGLITKGALLVLQSQFSTESLNLLNQENLLSKDVLTLVQFLDLDPREKYQILSPVIQGVNIDGILPGIDQIYKSAIENMPEMKEQEMNILASEYALKVSRSYYYPSLSFSGSIASWYSSGNKEILGYDPVFPFEAITEDISLGQQYSDNFYQAIALSLNIPIFNKYKTKQGIEISKINEHTTRLNYENQKNLLIKKIQLAYLDATSSYGRYQATQEQLKSVIESFNYADSKFSAGLIDFYTYLESLNNKTKAELEMVQSKYDYILKVKVLDLYQGKPLNSTP